MDRKGLETPVGICLAVATSALLGVTVLAQLIDKTQAPNAANKGINLSLTEEIGAGRGDVMTPNSSAFIIARDPFSRHSSRASAFPAQVHALPGPRTRSG